MIYSKYYVPLQCQSDEASARLSEERQENNLLTILINIDLLTHLNKRKEIRLWQDKKFQW